MKTLACFAQREYFADFVGEVDVNTTKARSAIHLSHLLRNSGVLVDWASPQGRPVRT